MTSTLWLCLMVILAHQMMDNQIGGFKHEHGSPNITGYDVMLNRRIFERTAAVPTNYTIFYKYVRDTRGGEIAYVGIDVKNCESKGNVTVRLNDSPTPALVVQATLNVTNCKRLNVTAQIHGYHASIASQLSSDPMLAEIFGEDIFKSKSFALIYAHNETRSEKHYISLGERQANDTLLKVEEQIVTKDFNSFPECEISYDNPNAFITRIQFVFNSPSATVYLNSTYIHPQSFNAIAYDLNRPQFTMHVNVFGYQANAKPAQYKSIIT